MKTRLRIALPKLDQIDRTTIVAFALFERGGRLLRSGEQPLESLAQGTGADWVEAILHPDDAVVATVQVPPVRSSQREDAINACVEPLTLSNIEDLCIAYGPRGSEGGVDVAWVDRKAVLHVWQMLESLGLNVQRITPLAHALPQRDPDPGRQLTLPVDARWQTPLPDWSFARPKWRPHSPVRQWKSTLYWVAAAVLVWLAGLQLYANQLNREMEGLRDQAVREVQNAFPQMSVVIDPLRQAQNERDALLRATGTAVQSDFIPLGLDIAALLGPYDIQLEALRYQDQMLTLELVENSGAGAAFETVRQTAEQQGLTLSRDEGKNNNIWRFSRNQVSEGAQR